MKSVAIVALCAGGLWMTACEEEHHHAYYQPAYRQYGYSGSGYGYGRYGYSGYYRPGYRYGYYRPNYYGAGYRYGYNYGPGSYYRRSVYSSEPGTYSGIAPIGERTTTTYRRVEPIGEQNTNTYRVLRYDPYNYNPQYNFNPQYWDTGDARARSREFIGMP